MDKVEECAASVGVINLGVREKNLEKLRQEGIGVDCPEFPTRLATITSILKEAGVNVEVFDLEIRSWSENNKKIRNEHIFSFLEKGHDLFLIFERCHNLFEISRLARILNSIDEQKNKIILTCANATKNMALMIWRMLKEHLSMLIYGEVELPFLLSNFNFSLETLKKCPNVLCSNGHEIHTKSENLTEDMMNSLPLPALKAFALEEYLQLNNYIPINLSRGCRFDCKHCAVREVYGKYWKKFQLKKVFEVVEQFKNSVKRETILSLNDEDIVFDLQWFKGICEIFESLDVSWDCKLRPDILSDEVANLLSSGNCKSVTISADVLYDYNPSLAQNIGKIITLKTLKRAFSLCDAKGIDTTLAIIPEFYPSAKSIINLIKECRPHSVALCPLRTFDSLSKNDSPISTNIEEIIDKIKDESVGISVVTGRGEQGW